ncbi:S8 family peptidase [Enterococcus sp.]|uniref:S8 family peptidase n=1 Tax=Enterococcus sp. TaxID=35783 RepID=UPI002FC8CA2E
MNREYPIIKFNQREQDDAKTPGGGGDKKPGFTLSGTELNEKGIFILDQINTIIDNWEDDVINDIPKMVEVKYIEKAKAKSHQSKIIDMFNNYNLTTQVGATSNDGIIVQVITDNQLNEIKKKFENPKENDIAISAIKTVERYIPKVNESELNQYNITFWNLMEKKVNEEIKEKVKTELSRNGIDFIESSFGSGEEVLEVSNVTLDKLEFIKRLPVKKIESTEKVNPFRLDNLEDVTDLPKLSFDPNKEYPVVGLLDSGVEINTYTSEWVERGEGCQYQNNQLDMSHGTYIASLLIHGDNFNGLNDFSIEGCKIIDVPILPNHQIDVKDLIHNIEEAVSNNLEVKIWNLSVSIEGEVDEIEFSTFAKNLDRIQNMYKVLFIKSAGNCVNFYNNEEPKKLSHGADSVQAITVGSLNRNSDQFNIVKSGYPSPYSRAGKGPSYIIKPELVHHGGDLFSTSPTPTSIADYEMSDSKGITIGEEIIQKPGTSFSTPKVAKIASEVLQLLNEPDTLLIKALLIHSATHYSDVELSSEEITKKMGFGKPKHSQSIISENNSHSVTLMLRSRLDKGKEIDIMDFPFPTTLVEDGNFKGRIIVTLVSNPYLRDDLASEYCQTNLDVKFGTFDEKVPATERRAIFNPIKRDESKNVLLDSVYSKRQVKANDEYNYERTLIKYGEKYYPVKKYACDLKEFTDANKKYLDSNRKWFVYLKGEYRDYIEKEQKRTYEEYIKGNIDVEEYEELGIEFCLLITIYDPDQNVDVYHSVVSELNTHAFQYEEVDISTHIDVQN